jgi:ElaB/YqjD/DUF883 family membrane-anchored ribosome-binding protein
MGKSIQTNGASDEVNQAMRHAATKLSDDLARTARDAREAAEELGSALRHSASDVADKAKARATETTRGLRRGVRQHPIAWLGAAAGVGALAGLLMVARRPTRD